MKTIKYLFAVIATVLSFTSCEEDGDKIYLQSLSGNELIASTTDVTLNADVAQQIVLSFAWTDQTIVISDENVGTAAKVVASLEASLSEDFSGTVSETETTSLSHAFTGAELNTIANTVGATIGQSNAIYFRLGSATGTNIPSAYSNVVKVNVTPYEMDMNTGIILDASKNATGESLYSANADGIYSGFIVANAWENFYMREGNGMVWGNIGEDGKPFVLSNESTQWNMWYPNASGCYYVTVNTQDEEWSALHVSSLTVSGLAGEDVAMTLNESSNEWLATFTADGAESRTITISGQGEQFNATTGTDSGQSTSIAFAMNGESLSLAETAGSINVEVPQAGECTIRLNLSDPTNWTVTVEAGGAEIPVTYPETLDVVCYSNDGSETFMTTLRLTDSANGIYTGTYSGEYRSEINIVDRTNGVWYGCDPTDNSKLSSADDKWNIWFDGSGAVSITVNLSEMTWYYTSATYPSSLSIYKFEDNTLGDKVIDLSSTDQEGVFTGVLQGLYNYNFKFVDNNGVSYGDYWDDSDPYGRELVNASDAGGLWIEDENGSKWNSEVNLTIIVDFTTMTWSYTENN